MHGPGPYAPTYSAAPYIIVRDGIAASLGALRRARWRRKRDKGLALWSPRAVTLVVQEIEPLVWDGGPFQPDYAPATTGLPSDMFTGAVPDRITLIRSTYNPAAPKYWPIAWAHAGYTPAAWFHLERIKSSAKKLAAMAPTQNNIYEMPRVVGHEVGHCLGLNHGSNGIMLGGMEPTAHDLESVHDWYV